MVKTLMDEYPIPMIFLFCMEKKLLPHGASIEEDNIGRTPACLCYYYQNTAGALYYTGIAKKKIW